MHAPNHLLRRRVRRADEEREEFEDREHEVARYLSRARGRLAATLDALDRYGLAGPGQRVLELGADPWLFTQLLLERGAEVVSAGQRRGVWREDERPFSPQRLSLMWNGRSEVLEHHLFNAERDLWPFRDGSFGCVLCMEVIEHLVFSPAHVLHEANRVLVQGGSFVLTTPNALAATKVAGLLRGRNVHGPYSGYGAGGRHNREFTPREVGSLLEAAAFAPDITVVNVEGYDAEDLLGDILRRIAGRMLPTRRDHIVAVASKIGPPRLAWNEDLYRSVDRARLRDEGVLLPDETATVPEQRAEPSVLP